MVISRPATWLFLLIVGVGLWTGVHHLVRGVTGAETFLFLTSTTFLIVGLIAFLTDRMRLTKWAVISGMALLVLATLAG